MMILHPDLRRPMPGSREPKTCLTPTCRNEPNTHWLLQFVKYSVKVPSGTETLTTEVLEIISRIHRPKPKPSCITSSDPPNRPNCRARVCLAAVPRFLFIAVCCLFIAPMICFPFDRWGSVGRAAEWIGSVSQRQRR